MRFKTLILLENVLVNVSGRNTFYTKQRNKDKRSIIKGWAVKNNSTELFCG